MGNMANNVPLYFVELHQFLFTTPC